MAFSISGNTVTITGTETDETLATAVAAIATVTPNLIRFTAQTTLANNGTLNVGNRIIENAVFLGNTAGRYNFGVENASLQPSEGGMLNITFGSGNRSIAATGQIVQMIGTKVLFNSASRCDLGGAVLPTPQFILNGATLERVSGTSNTILFYGRNAILRGDPVTFIGLTAALQNPEGISIQTSVNIRGGTYGVAAASSNGLLLADLEFSGVAKPVYTKYYTSLIAGNLQKSGAGWFQKNGDNLADPYIKKFARVKIRAVGDGLAPIAGAVVYVADENPLFGPDESGVRGLNIVTTSANGLSGQILARQWSTFYNDHPSVVGDTPATIFQDHSVTVAVLSYNRQINATSYGPALIRDYGTKDTYEDVFSPVDTNVTLTQAQAAALTQIDTLDQLYDAGKDWKCQPTQARIEYPTVSTQPITANGTEINLGNRNLVIDGTASVDFSINTGTNTITIKSINLAAGVKFKSLTTAGNVTFANGGTITVPYTDASGTRVTIKTTDNLALSTYITIDGVQQAWQVGLTARNIFVTPSSVVRIYAHAYGYQPKIINVTGNNPNDYITSLLPETNVDTTLNTTTRDTIVSSFLFGADAFSRLYLSVNTDLRQYTPAEVLNALHYFSVTQGELIATAATFANSVAGFSLMRGGFIVASPSFYGKVADSVTTTTNLGILVPLSIYVDPSVYVAVPTYTPVEKNTSGIVLQYAPWTQQEADIPSWVAKEATLLQSGIDIISEINANEVKIDAIKTNTDLIPATL